jgi:hypothetical protein
MRQGPKPAKSKEAKPPVARKSPKGNARVRDLETRLAEALRDKAEAQEQHAATAEILSVISRSPTDIQLTLETIAQNAARVCGASDAIIRRVEGDLMMPAAHFGTIPVSNAPVRRPITRNSVAGRALLEGRTIHQTNPAVYEVWLRMPSVRPANF